MKKALVLLGFLLFSSFISPFIKEAEIPVFLVTEEPKVITKGYYHSVFIVELTFEHAQLQSFIENPLNTHTLFLMDHAFLRRADHIISLLKKHNRQTGLIVSTAEQLEKELDDYNKIMLKQPLWITLQSQQYTSAFRQAAAAHQLNIISPSVTVHEPFPAKIEKGSFVRLQLSENNDLSLTPLLTWLQAQSFSSIEESLFGLSTQQKNSFEQ